VLISAWSLVSANLDPRAARTVLPLAGFAYSLGWAIGGLCVPAIVSRFGASSLLLPSTACFAWAALFTRSFSSDEAAPSVADDRSAMRAGWRAITANPLVRTTVALSVLSLLCEQIYDFLFYDAASTRFAADPDKIGAFCGAFNGLTALVSMFVLVTLSSRVLRGVGAIVALAITPALTLGPLALVAVWPLFAPVVMLRGTDRTLKSTLWSSAIERVQMPIAVGQRSQVRAIARGVIAPLAYGLFALVVTQIPYGWLHRVLPILACALTALIVWLVLFSVPRSYAMQLRASLSSKSFATDKDAATTPLGPEAFAALAEQMRQPDEDRALLALELLGQSGARAAAPSIRLGLAHASADVRAQSLRWLARLRDESAQDDVASALIDDADSEVRAAAGRYLRAIAAPSSAARLAVMRALESDPDVHVRAIHRITTLLWDNLDQPTPALTMVLRADCEDDCLEALRSLQKTALSCAPVHAAIETLLASDTPRIALAALETTVRLRARTLLPFASPLVENPSTAEAALTLLLSWSEHAVQLAVQNIAPASTLRTPLSFADSEQAPSSEAFSRLVGHQDARVRERASRALERWMSSGRGHGVVKQVLSPILECEIEQAYESLSLLAGIAHDDGVADYRIEPPFALLASEIERQFFAARKRIMQLICLCEDPQLAAFVATAAQKTSRLFDARLAELLELSLSPQLAAKIVPLFDRLDLAARIAEAKRLGLLSPAARNDPMAAIVATGDRLLVGCAIAAYDARFEVRYPHLFGEVQPLLAMFERMRFLKGVPLFSELAAEDVRELAQAVATIAVPAGDVVFRKGDVGEHLFVVQSGTLQAKIGAAVIETFHPHDFFGELAVVDREPRSADVIAVTDSTLLQLSREALETAMAKRPQIIEQLLLVMVRRVRAMNEQRAAERAR
jgi:hypothetical protein